MRSKEGPLCRATILRRVLRFVLRLDIQGTINPTHNFTKPSARYPFDMSQPSDDHSFETDDIRQALSNVSGASTPAVEEDILIEIEADLD